MWAAHAGHGFPATSVPFSMVFGPRNMIAAREQAMFRRILDGRPVLVPGDGTTLLQLGHVDDQARALEQMMGMEVTFGRRYNLTGSEFVTRNHYVATIATVIGADSVDVRPIPAPLMDKLWTGEVLVDPGAGPRIDIEVRATTEGRAHSTRSREMQRFQLAQLVQHLAPNLHHWNRSTIFSIERLRADAGWEPEHTFESMVDDTYRWYRDAGLGTTQDVDWTFENAIVKLLD